ncbi:Phosphatidylglycerol/phosphatidylinositol transfer protein [Coemansia sp. RSA 1807]|nr:Phosphatidylglycerol/phosphatidylinositol transfer protein [Coemansia sp. RSA 1752]KAJ1784778.1 Phosphatidylglycerol/phosphatidylinositol transfer protein [Coemansia sp. RSA 1938]KAJ2124462.1 Phosphatidylglycerol/phosphatidylinositol transfer protein [Coemansia sp. RSA 921]KAJ2197476.1 Phosphatidylglycerol/phosphatidylinositol transfer protein [Coemansia sp. RSA 522]KAJ2205926.1 Phosphatidylglycerol/phosphatidylinositol transfer protein [Coemansia sp. RSA 521]KAJ2229649.1 Phosphatidylglycer
MKLFIPALFALGALHTSSGLSFGSRLQLVVQEASGIFDMLDQLSDDMGKNHTLNPVMRDVSHTDDILDIKYVDIDPEAPKRSTPIHLTALAHVKERIDKATANVKVKYGFLTLLNRNYDLCEELKSNLNRTCPVDEGPIEFAVDVDVPGFIPPGWFHLEATAWRDSDEKQLGRILADVKF